MKIKGELETLYEIRNRMYGQQLAIEIDIVYFGRLILRPIVDPKEANTYHEMLEKSRVQVATTIECIEIIDKRIQDLKDKAKKAN